MPLFQLKPDELADRVLCLAELKSDQGGTGHPTDLIWLQIPLRKAELEALKRKAIIEDKSLLMLIRECIFEAIR